MLDRCITFGGHVTRVVVRRNLLAQVGGLLRDSLAERRASTVVVLTDDNVGPLYAATVRDSVAQAGYRVVAHQASAGEAAKSWEGARALYGKLAECRVTRDAVLLSLGGGVVSDLGGFVAATWMRGIRSVICPTTLESDVDACLGGKTAINIPGGKNLVGVFHQPALVAVDPACLKSLGDRDLRAGMAESIKHAMISSEEFLGQHEAKMDTILDRDEDILADLIKRNLEIKADVVVGDPKEQSGGRMILNFGHTIGHAVEECCGYSMRHGECVALGMLAACRLSAALGLLNSSIIDRLERLLTSAGLPTKLAEPIETDRVIETISRDKKALGATARFVLLEDVGKPVVRKDVPESLVRDAYESLLS